MKRNCQKCSKEIEVTQGMLDRGRGKYCSKKCKGLGWDSSGENNNNWNGGMTMHQYGYILVKAPNHPNKDRHGYMRKHRLVVEEYIGRYLLPTEDIDHINGIKTDNRIENLQILSRSEHVKLEHKRGVYAEKARRQRISL